VCQTKTHALLIFTAAAAMHVRVCVMTARTLQAPPSTSKTTDKQKNRVDRAIHCTATAVTVTAQSAAEAPARRLYRFQRRDATQFIQTKRFRSRAAAERPLPQQQQQLQRCRIKTQPSQQSLCSAARAPLSGPQHTRRFTSLSRGKGRGKGGGWDERGRGQSAAGMGQVRWCTSEPVSG
jgi:hypothetical protein